ncbi:PLP-dependent aminotransferase family protein [Paenibacillus pasadenensis]|nr:PLP-dependent aminotransferase family protein [Paenibacillus pasadenensis]
MEPRLAYERLLDEGRSKREALYESLKAQILDGGSASGERLPSTRRMAELYGLSRGTVSQAYDMLRAEGYVDAEQGSGTYAAYEAGVLRQGQEREQEPIGPQARSSGSDWFKRLEAASPPAALPDAADSLEAAAQRFASGRTDFRLFPAGEWKQALYAAVRQSLERPLEDGGRELTPAGSPELREAIAALLRRERGIHADPASIVVTSGSKQALALLLQTLIGPGERFVMENPGYGGIREAALAAGAEVLGAKVDELGIVPDDWDASLAAVTPNRQFPTGAVLPASRRAELLAWAERRGALLLEDDYDGEFRYTGRPGEPLKAMDAQGRVVYLGSFSRIMYSGLRIGYAVAPPWLVSRLVRAKSFYEPYSSGQLEQLALARFLQEGRYARHLGRIRRQYRRRLSALHAGLASLSGQPFRWSPAHAGLHQYAAWTAGEERYERLLRLAQERKIGWSDGRKYWIAQPGETKRPEPGALFGFAHLTEEEIGEGMKRLAEAWRSAKRE